jgi:hypothetical protein
MSSTHYVTRHGKIEQYKKNRGLILRIEEWRWYEFLEKSTTPESSWTWGWRVDWGRRTAPSIG